MSAQMFFIDCVGDFEMRTNHHRPEVYARMGRALQDALLQGRGVPVDWARGTFYGVSVMGVHNYLDDPWGLELRGPEVVYADRPNPPAMGGPPPDESYHTETVMYRRKVYHFDGA